MQIPWIVKYQYAATLFFVTVALTKVTCFQFNFPSFPDDSNLLLLGSSRIFLDAIQVTLDSRGSIQNYSGRALYRKPYQLWNQNQIASFNTTFVLRITPETTPGGEGLAFILTSDRTVPEKSDGQWIGIVNATSNGTSQPGILAVEFDTRHSFTEDGPDNHVGININSINSIQQVSLINSRVNLSSGQDIKFHIQYMNDTISVFGAMSGTSEESMETLLVSPPLNLSSFLQKEVYVGFSASTSNYTERNCVRSWDFSGDDIRDDDNSLLWIYVAVPIVIVLIIIGGLAIFFFRWQKIRHMEGPEDAYPRIEDQIKYSSMAPKKFRQRDLTKATGGFSLQNKLGQGGFGTVYKGLLENKEVAVKRVSKNSRQGKQEFLAEVTTIGSLHHRNLVKLTGWCYENREFLLVYEFMPNGSLDKYLFCEKDSGNNYDFERGYSITLDWETRRRVIHGVAQALDYLHDGCERRVLHRDIKASNIMLDSDYNAKLGDFGLARTIQKRNETHHSTKEIAGTPGYMAPETFLVGRATVETDVYAFGVLVLEVVCGKRPGNVYAQDEYKNSIVYRVWDLYEKGKVVGAVDARLKKEEIVEEEVDCVLVLGLACCHPNPHKRPSMRTVLQVLNGEAAPPEVPKERPVFMWPAMPPSFKEAEDSSLIQGTLTPFTEITGR